jgi:4-aminobutyrate aminotransferase/(S)-3-amino-2-methylpropionate transaminase
VIADEIWTGMGRSGAMVRSTAVGIEADILCFGKGLGGGLAISACVAAEDVMMAWAGEREVVHTSTHAGSPLGCVAAIATLDALRFRKLPARAKEVGEVVRGALHAALDGLPGVVDVRGEGLMIGVELDGGARALRAMRGMLERGYVVITGGERSETLTLTPPLTIREERLADAVVALREVLTAA